jgi:ketosteroid isomerase-like protein
MAPTGQDLIARVREIVDAVNRGDFDAAAALAHPEVVIARAGGLPDMTGREVLRAWMEPDAFESQTYELLEAQEAGHRVLTRIRTVARGAGSGIDMEVFTWSVWTFDQDGMIVRSEYFLDHDEAAAREAAGLPD